MGYYLLWPTVAKYLMKDCQEEIYHQNVLEKNLNCFQGKAGFVEYLGSEIQSCLPLP